MSKPNISKAKIVIATSTDSEVELLSMGVPDTLLVALKSIKFKAEGSETVKVAIDENSFFVVAASDSAHPWGVANAVANAVRLAGKSAVEVLAPKENQDKAVFGALLGNYRAKDLDKAATSINFSKEFNKDDVKKGEKLASAVLAAIDLINSPANKIYPETFVDKALEITAPLKLKSKVLDEKALKAGGYGAILSVGSGSARPPRLLSLNYKPKGAKKHLVLVGKGITFDSGGLSLKPAASMGTMKYDMAGAASVLAAIVAIASLELKIEVTSIMCLAENMPSATATRPGDVITSLSGKTIEVTNTDAEGRLVLADGITHGLGLKPDYLVDIATLTGAISVALGGRLFGIFGDEDIVEAGLSASRSAGEDGWHLPMPAHLNEMLASEVADYANTKNGNSFGGSSIGALFLEKFAKTNSEDAPQWLHLDIAGAAWNTEGPRGVIPKGATGVGIRTLVQLAENLQ
ncbi:MAG: leucyl aminopeptidase [Microbacteriaceae bacterium]|nr:leucyl aminopeptidase [Microbacteriaceae bacterium]